MEFASLNYSYLLVVVLIAILLGLKWHLMNSRLRRFIDERLHEKLLPSTRGKNVLSWGFLLLAVIFIVISLFRPRFGYSTQEIEGLGVDIAVALDLSSSMLVRDVQPTRLERAKRDLEDLISGLQGDRISLIAFSQVAFIEMPLTLDYSTFHLFLERLTPSHMPAQGTSVKAALKKSFEALLGANYRDMEVDSRRGRAVLLITDGENFSEDISKERAIAATHNIRIFIIGIGTTQGGPIPGGSGYRKDKNAHLIISKLNRSALAKLAKDSGGVYVESVASSKDTEAVYEEGIKRYLKDSRLRSTESKVWNEYFQVPLLLAIVCLLLSCMVRTGGRKQRMGIFLLFFLFLPFDYAKAQTAERLGERGVEAIWDGNFSEARDKFSRAKEKKEDSRIYYSDAYAAYRQGKFEEAKDNFLKAAELTADKNEKAKAIFNAANSLVQTDKFEEAVSLYQSALNLIPEDTETKENLSFTKGLIKKQEEQDSEQKEEQEEKEKQEEKEENSEEKNPQQEQGEKEQESESSKENSSQEQEKKQKEGEKENQEEDSDSQSSNEGEQQKPQNEEQENEKQQGENNQEKEEEENKEDSKQSDKEDEQKESDEQAEQSEGEQAQEEEKPSEGNGEETSQILYDQLEGLLDNVVEKRGALAKYREIEARKQLQQMLEEENRKIENDW